MTRDQINRMSGKVRPLLFIIGFLSAFSGKAQFPTQSLFFRAQLLEFRILNGQFPINYGNPTSNPAYSFKPGVINFPIKCNPAHSIVYDTWLQAEDLFMAMRWDEAALLYEGCVKRDSSLCDAYFRLGQTYALKGDFLRAVLIFKRAEEKFPGNPMVYLGLGQLFLILEKPEEALRHFNKIEALDAGNPEYNMGVSSALFQTKRYSDALDYYLRGKQKFITHKIVPDPHFVIYSKSREIPPEFSYLEVYEATLYYHLNQTQKSLDLLKRTSVLRQDADILGVQKYYTGLCYLAKGQSYYDKAKGNLKKASDLGIRIDPVLAKKMGLVLDPTSFKNLARLENYSNENECSPPDNLNKIKFVEAEEAFENRRISESIELYSQLIQTDPKQCYLYKKLAECYQIQGKGNQALNVYKSAHQKFLAEINITLSLAQQFFYLDSMNSALSMYNTAIRLRPWDYRGYYGACLLLAHQGKIRESLDLLQLNRENAYYPPSMIALEGVLNYKLGAPQIAIDKFNSAPASYNGDPVALYFMALSYHSLGQKYSAKASDSLLEAIEQGAIVDESIEIKLGLDPKVRISQVPR